MDLNQQDPLRHLSTADLVRHALDEAKLLAKAEVLHAKEEFQADLGRAKVSGILLGAAALLALVALTLLFAALAMAIPLHPAVSLLIVAGALLLIGGLAGFFGYKKFPRKPMHRTQERLKKDFEVTREQLA